MDLTTADRLLTTTRSVRKRLDLERPVPPELIEACIDIAIQAPTGSNAQGWHFLVVTDPVKKREIAGYYAKAFMAYRKLLEDAPPRWEEGDPRGKQESRVYDSANYLAEHLHEVPVHLIACVKGRVEKATRAGSVWLCASRTSSNTVVSRRASRWICPISASALNSELPSATVPPPATCLARTATSRIGAVGATRASIARTCGARGETGQAVSGPPDNPPKPRG